MSWFLFEKSVFYGILNHFPQILWITLLSIFLLENTLHIKKKKLAVFYVPRFVLGKIMSDSLER